MKKNNNSKWYRKKVRENVKDVGCSIVVSFFRDMVAYKLKYIEQDLVEEEGPVLKNMFLMRSPNEKERER